MDKMTARTDAFKGAGALVTAAIVYALFGVLIRMSGWMFTDIGQVFVRLGIAGLICGLYVFLRRSPRLRRKKALAAAALGVMFAVTVFLFTVSVENTKLANSIALLYATSITTSFLIGTIRLGERVTKQKVAALILVMIGLAFYSGAIVGGSVGVIAALVTGFFDAVHNTLNKFLGDLPKMTVLAYKYLAGGAVALAVLLVSGKGLTHDAFNVYSLVAVIIFGIMLVWLGGLVLYGFKHINLNIGTVILAAEIVVGALIGYMLYREVPTPQEAVAIVMISVAVILASVDFGKKTKLAAGGK